TDHHTTLEGHCQRNPPHRRGTARPDLTVPQPPRTQRNTLRNKSVVGGSRACLNSRGQKRGSCRPRRVNEWLRHSGRAEQMSSSDGSAPTAPDPRSTRLIASSPPVQIDSSVV